MLREEGLQNFYLFLSYLSAQGGAQTQDPEIEGHTLYQLRQPGAPR